MREDYNNSKLDDYKKIIVCLEKIVYEKENSNLQNHR